jgi:hypothetical protein
MTLLWACKMSSKMVNIVIVRNILVHCLLLVRHWKMLASMSVRTETTGILRQVYRETSILRCKKTLGLGLICGCTARRARVTILYRGHVWKWCSCLHVKPIRASGCELNADAGKHSLCYSRMYRFSRQFLARVALNYALYECRMHC